MVSIEMRFHIRWKPMHDYIVTPVHREVSYVQTPQRPVTEKLLPIMPQACCGLKIIVNHKIRNTGFFMSFYTLMYHNIAISDSDRITLRF